MSNSLPNPKEILSYVDDSIKTITTLEQEKKALQTRIEALESDNIKLEKVASTRFTFDSESLDVVLNDLTKLAFINDSGKEQLTELIADDPNVILGVITKMAQITLSAPSSGAGITKLSADRTPDEDPHGWLDFFNTVPRS